MKVVCKSRSGKILIVTLDRKERFLLFILYSLVVTQNTGIENNGFADAKELVVKYLDACDVFD